MIDAGHGGTDPGKSVLTEAWRKTSTWLMAERLKTYLQQDDVKVIMTGDGHGALFETDSRKKMADMKKRCEIIEESGADLVVSIHQNSYHEEAVSGGQVFITGIQSKGKALAAILQDRFDYVLGEQKPETSEGECQLLLLLHEMSDRDREQPKGSSTFEQRGSTRISWHIRSIWGS